MGPCPKEETMKGRAIIIGGSIGGLFTSALLRKVGWEVDVYERVDVELAGRGAGIVTHKPLLDALEAAGAGTQDLGVVAERRVAYDRAGNETHAFDFPQLVTSWDRLQNLTRATLPDEHYHLDHWLDRFEETSEGVRAYFKNGHIDEADLIIGADGFRSGVRGQIFPNVQPEYSGYVVWRGVADEADLSLEVQNTVFKDFGFYLPEGGGEVIGYPIAGVANDLRPGHRRYNWVWYRVVEPQDLKNMLTDETGVTHDISIPPPLIRKGVINQLKNDAHDQLSPQLASILDNVAAPFFTPIYDHASPSMVHGRAAMVGDAAFVARPHIGAGVTKAAEDAVALAKCLEEAETVQDGLIAYNAARLDADRIAYERARYMGEYLIPKYNNEAEKAEWRRHHNIETIMRDTAVLNFY